jgi:trans-2,3-dihydro-3-hydroxyanthranilate isomerase
LSIYPFDWVDAFTDQPFGGNGCAVVYDEGALDVETCLKYTRETSLVECTFVGPSDVADLKVRYFLAEREIPFAGHPTIATVVSALSRGRAPGPRLTLETGAGVLDIEVADDGTVTMTQAKPEFGQLVPSEMVGQVVGLAVEDIISPPQVVSTGLPFCVTVVRDLDAVKRAVLDVGALAAFRSVIKHKDADVMEPYVVALSGATTEGDTFGRLMLAPPNPDEDPFTGSATGCVGAYLWKYGLVTGPIYVAEQGHGIGRPGRATVEVLGAPDDITGVRVGGKGVIVMRGDVIV